VGIQGFLRASRKFLVGLVVVGLIGGLTYGGVKYYRYSKGAEQAFQKLHVALTTGDKLGLAVMVDFRSLSEDMIRAVAAVYPQAATDEMRQVELQDEAQQMALNLLSGKKGAKPDPSAKRKLFSPVPLLPDDIFPQIAAGLRLETRSNERHIWTRFRHGDLQAIFPMHMLFEQRRDAWVVTRLLNAHDLVSMYKEAADTLHSGDESERAEDNERIMNRMRAFFHAPQCQASVSLLDGKNEAVLVVKVTANNAETETLHHVNLLCDVGAAGGKPVFSRQLNVVQRVSSGAAFSNTWTVVLDAQSEEAVGLLRAGPLSCTVDPKVLSVGMGEILYPRKNE
jgi:hypothetical protein